MSCVCVFVLAIDVHYVCLALGTKLKLVKVINMQKHFECLIAVKPSMTWLDCQNDTSYESHYCPYIIAS